MIIGYNVKPGVLYTLVYLSWGLPILYMIIGYNVKPGVLYTLVYLSWGLPSLYMHKYEIIFKT